MPPPITTAKSIQDGDVNDHRSLRPLVPILALTATATYGYLSLATSSTSSLLLPPELTIWGLDFLLCLALAYTYRKQRYWQLVLAQPFVCAFLIFSYQTNFSDLGDASAYSAAVASYTTETYTSISWTSIHNSIRDRGVLTTLTSSHFGIAPTYLISYSISRGTPSEATLYLTQMLFYTFTLTFALTIAHTIRTLNDRTIAAIATVAIGFPNTYVLLSAPTRHGLTFCAALLFFIGHQGLSAGKNRLLSACSLTLGVLLTLISKPPLLIPITVYAALHPTLTNRKLSVGTTISYAFAISTLALFLDYFAFTVKKYSAYTSQQQSASDGFDMLIGIPVLGIPIKYVYSMLSPFPYSKALIHTTYYYGGSWPTFALHVSTGLIGIYIAITVLSNARMFWRFRDQSPVQLLFFSVVMSLSILLGATGFNSYLIIYYPLALPAIAKYCQGRWKVAAASILFVMACEVAVDLLNYFK